MQTQSQNLEKPALLSSASAPSNPVISLFQKAETSDLERDFLEVVTETAESAGCLFLFEMPGSFFEKPDYRAAVVLHGFEETREHLVFILCNKETGTLEIYDEVDVSVQVTEFVGSYANVLSCLQRVDSLDPNKLN